MSAIRPPVSVAGWLRQVNDDPSIPEEFKKGKEDQLGLTNATFKSGSLLNSTDFLHLRTIWHPHVHITSLGDMIKNNPDKEWTGLVSNENISKANYLFHEKESDWRQYLNELELRATEGDSWQTMRPSKDCGHFWQTVYDQTHVLLETNVENPTTEQIERAYMYAIPDSSNAHIQNIIPLAVVQHLTPITPKPRITRQFDRLVSAATTPKVASYQPARGGKFNRPAADEELVSSALLSFLKPLTGLIGSEFATLNWLDSRLRLRLTEAVHTTNLDTGHVSTELRPVMEARVDGYLYRTDNLFGQTLNKDPLALIEVKPFTFRSAVTAIRRQVGAEMASWISQAGDSTTGCLQRSQSGRQRRLMITQHRHEIYIIIGEYGPGFEAHIRPSRSVVSGSDNTDPEAIRPPLDRSITEFPNQKVRPSRALESMLASRPTNVLWGSPAFTRRVEDMSIQVSGDAGAVRRNPQLTRPPAVTRRSKRIAGGGKWEPDAGDFLVMHEFGPFLTTDRSHMDLFIRRYIALMLELRGPQHGFTPDPISTKFLENREPREAFT